jgi:aryl-alcohol dehydrogenase-like predicted oxidoreductase
LLSVEREKLFIISKVGLPDCDGIKNEDINSYGLSKMNLINSLENILERLQTKYIDLLQIQAWDPSVNVYDVVRDLDELIKKGKIRYFGVSNFKGWQLQKILDASRFLLDFLFKYFLNNFIKSL